MQKINRLALNVATVVAILPFVAIAALLPKVKPRNVGDRVLIYGDEAIVISEENLGHYTVRYLSNGRETTMHRCNFD